MENLVGYAQQDLFVPLLAEAQLAGRPVTLSEANTAARVWMDEVNSAVHSQIEAVPTTRWPPSEGCWLPCRRCGSRSGHRR